MNTYTKMSSFLSISEVAVAFNVTKATVREWAKSGALSARKIGKQWYFPKADVFNVQSMSDALEILGEKSQPSKKEMFDVLLDNTRIEVKSSRLRENKKHGKYWTFSSIHSPEQSDFYLLIGYDEKRSKIDTTFYIPTAELFNKLPDVVTKGTGVAKVRKLTHSLEGKSFIVSKDDEFFKKYILDVEKVRLEEEDMELDHLRGNCPEE